MTTSELRHWEPLLDLPITAEQALRQCSEPARSPTGTTGKCQEDGTEHKRTEPLAVVRSRAEESENHRARRIRPSVRKRQGRPADSRQAFSPARPGQSETDLGFSGQALEKPAGFMEAWWRL